MSWLLDLASTCQWRRSILLKQHPLTSWHHFHLTVTHNCQHLPQFCPCNSGNETLYIHPIWMREAICSGLQSKPWHHGIISNEQSPWIANIWCWKSQKLGSWTVSNLLYNYLIQWFMRWWQCLVVLNLEIMSYVLLYLHISTLAIVHSKILISKIQMFCFP
jgi:hypothetical protein